MKSDVALYNVTKHQPFSEVKTELGKAAVLESRQKHDL